MSDDDKEFNPIAAAVLGTEQNNPIGFWQGNEGDAYIARNRDDHLLSSYTAMWSKILARAPGITRVLEVGANIGTNLNALSWLRPDLEITACEPNGKACEELRRTGYHTIQKPIEAINAPGHPRDVEQFDLVFTRGVLIHIPPHNLLPVLMKMAELTDRYIVLAEYYSPTPQEIEYRGRKGLLWKDDFAGLMMQVDKTLRLVDYGFCYRRDPTFPQDDVTWFLLERRA